MLLLEKNRFRDLIYERHVLVSVTQNSFYHHLCVWTLFRESSIKSGYKYTPKFSFKNSIEFIQKVEIFNSNKNNKASICPNICWVKYKDLQLTGAKTITWTSPPVQPTNSDVLQKYCFLIFQEFERVWIVWKIV